MRVGLYARVSTADQHCANQLEELRRYAAARGWEAVEYVDEGVSGARETRPALDMLIGDVRRRKVDVVACWALDRLGRNLRHLVTMMDEFQALGVAFISLKEAIDATSPAGKLQLHILAALAEFERSRISDRVRLGLARAKAQGIRLGRPRVRIAGHKLAAVQGLTVSEAAQRLGVSRSTAHRMMVRSLKTQDASR